MPKHLLRYLEAMTSHRDTALLDTSVLTSLRDLLQVNDIRLYDLAYKGDDIFYALTTWCDGEGIHSRHSTLVDEDYQSVSCHPQIAACANSGGPMVTLDEHDEPHQFLPIHVENQIFGCCEIHYPAPPTRHKRDLAKGILGLYRNYLTLLEDSQTDTLTGLPNRKTFERNLARLLIRGDAHRRPGRGPQERRQKGDEENWLVIIDLDHFKQINDQFGHLYGDEVLVLLSDLMRRTFRQHDHIFRFGGDEFVVLLRQISYENAKITLERLRRRVASHVLPEVGPLTASCGFAMIRPEDTPVTVLGNADDALYYAKENGRDQIQCFQKLLESGLLPGKQSSVQNYPAMH
jgi:diguanylate cyclase (GGDEF)-like protein